MSRIVKAFANKAKVAYLTAGDGENSEQYFIALAKGGANVLEVGIPFSDPTADGLIIQKAMERSLKAGTDVKKVLEIIKQIRLNTEAAIIVFTYFNPIRSNLEYFLAQAKQSGADGVLVVDLPFEESSELRFLCAKYDLANISVTAPSTPLSRIKLIANNSSGFLYYACRKGTTGLRDELPLDLIERITEVRKYSSLPVAIGFGVSNNQMVQRIFKIADGCVVGSYFVDAVSKQVPLAQLELMAANIFNYD
ncbi:MAG: tryptophan synthase subunit alpha [Burkholderiales bacterium]|nr:tryptophan synthase subunit alpha [Burkholderiales bacterium]